MEPLEHPEDQFVRDVSMPLEPEEHAIQLELLRSFLGAEQKNILDLGCGVGRLLPPWRNRAPGGGLGSRGKSLGSGRSSLRHARGPGASGSCDDQPLYGPFDAVLLLGNTLMELVSPDEVVGLLHRIKACLSAQGVLIIEDIPGLYWPLLSSGQWGDGEADGFRMVWSDRDMIFSLREGQAAQDDGPLRSDEPQRRLWSESLLQSVLARAGWESSPGEHPLVRVVRPARS